MENGDLHIHGKDNLLLKSKPMIAMVNKPWKEFLASDVQKPEIEQFKKHERTGRPLGDNSFVKKLESIFGGRLRPLKPGPKVRDK